MATQTDNGFSIKRFLIGKPLETRQMAHQAVGKVVGLAVFASDALSSTAYATEEILLILALAGTSAAVFNLSIPIALAIAALLIIVTISYRQTIYAYPNGGGAYIVARDNLGEVAAQIAGAALLTDYILTVAVSISSGVAQITSAFPALLPLKVHIALIVITIMTIVNLRGVKESGSIFAVPTYFFLVMMFLTLGVGAYQYFTGTLSIVQGVESLHEDVLAPLTLFLILRAFSSGCTALTGIEAISNGITAFKAPKSHNAAITLQWMSAILITLFLGITLLAHQIQAIPTHSETVISQLARTIYGNGSPFYLLTLAGTAMILLMAANTSYADFPRLAALHAGDGFLPRQLTFRGSRLVFSVGIMTLAVLAGLLVVIARATVSALIPLYAVGVFLSFTISQAGMVVRLWKTGKLKVGEVVKGLETDLTYDPQWFVKMLVSGFGALCTGVVMLVFAITKFTSGAWFIVVLVPLMVLALFRIHHHYKEVAATLSLQGKPALPLVHKLPVQSVVLIDNVHAGTIKLINAAKSLDGDTWHAIHIAVDPNNTEKVKERWHTYVGDDSKLNIVESPYRELVEPLREHLEALLDENPNCYVHLIMGHLKMDTPWEQALHQNSAYIFNLALTGLERIMVTIVPYQIHHVHGHSMVPEKAIESN